MKIGNIEFGPQPLFLAPMEDVTDIGFRMLCKRFGAAMVYTEFVSAEALVRSIKSTVSKLTISDEERPVGIQIYGRTTEDMVEAAKIVEQAKPDVIDINFGCPVKKVAGKGAGAGMLRNIPLMLDITREVVKAVNVGMARLLIRQAAEIAAINDRTNAARAPPPHHRHCWKQQPAVASPQPDRARVFGAWLPSADVLVQHAMFQLSLEQHRGAPLRPTLPVPLRPGSPICRRRPGEPANRRRETIHA